MQPGVDQFIRKVGRWQEEFERLRAILLETPLTEEVKWGAPCYTYEGKNLIMLGGFKEYCIISFFKGALLSDPQGILQKPGENTQSGRVIRFTNVQQIEDLEPVLRAFIYEAIEAEKAGLKVTFKKTEAFDVPAELTERFQAMPALKDAFQALTPGRQRAYLLYFGAARQSATRASRIEKWIPQILNGKGLNDW